MMYNEILRASVRVMRIDVAMDGPQDDVNVTGAAKAADPRRTSQRRWSLDGPRMRGDGPAGLARRRGAGEGAGVCEPDGMAPGARVGV